MKVVGRKLISFAIDYVILSIIVGIFHFCATVFFLDKKTMSQGEIMLLCAVITVFFYTVYFPYKNNGQTFGEKVMKLRIYNKNGKERTCVQYFIRECLVKFVMGPLFIVFSVCYMVMGFIQNKGHFPDELPHDFLLKTEVKHIQYQEIA